jgi:CheY-like chemotaxis protein
LRSDEQPLGADPAASSAHEELRTDVRRALSLLAEGEWVRAEILEGGRVRAAVHPSRRRADSVPMGADVLDVVHLRGYVTAGRRLQGGAYRFDLAPGGRAALAADDARPRGRRCWVLVVDDGQAARDELVGALRDQPGYVVLGAADAREALRVCRAIVPDAVLVDLTMADVDGFGLLRRLRAMPAMAGVACVGVTPRHNVRRRRGRALAAGCDAVLGTPIRPVELFNTLRRCLEPPG